MRPAPLDEGACNLDLEASVVAAPTRPASFLGALAFCKGLCELDGVVAVFTTQEPRARRMRHNQKTAVHAEDPDVRRWTSDKQEAIDACQLGGPAFTVLGFFLFRVHARDAARV